ncbi:5-formyltetrahydrofolate cyclo-ligase [Burkholderiaceae bacterium DAT-1]|nr:5-formyltetrahydrofolate cyclo-ligase [Burkholderiaceae bacterium DAT-1]
MPTSPRLSDTLKSSKAELRKALRRRRAAIPVAERQRAATEVARRLRTLRLLKRGRRVAAYLALGSELSLDVSIVTMLRFGVDVCVPVVPRRGRKMHFASLLDPHGRWQRNCYGISEYVGKKRVRGRDLDAVLVPLTGFDAQGGRMGQGGGYYDCTFSFSRQRQHWRKPRLIGIAYDCQRVDSLPLEAHDARLDAVLTESRVYEITTR